MAPKAKIPSIIECRSESTLREELERARASISLAESEETWDTISNALLRIIALSKGGACDFPTTLTSSIRSMYRSIASAAASERSRLSATAVECIAALASGLGPSFDPLVPLFIPTLLSLCSRPNKVFISRAKATIQTIIDQTQLISLLPYFVGALRDKSVTLRLIAIESLFACVQCLNPPDLEKDARARDVENAIRLTATDASADVRRISRQVFDAYKILLPARVESFAAPLSPTMKKYLNIDIPSGNSRPQSSQSTYTLPPTRPTSSLASAPPKREEPHPRPATSMSHHRSASSSTLASSKSSAMASKLTRSETGPTIAPPNERWAAGPSSKRKDNMPPPAIVPQRRRKGPSGPQVSLECPVPTGRPESKVPERPREQSTSRTATHILRPESTQPSAPPLKQYTGPLRAEAMTIKERLLGGAQRVLLPDAQQPPEPTKPLSTCQEMNVSADAQIVPRRSRLDSVRHGPKSSAAMDARRAVAQIVGTSSSAPKRPEISPPVLVEGKEAPIPATEGKKDGSKPRFGGKGKGISTKTPDSGVGGKKDVQKAGPSAPDHPKFPVSERAIGQGGPEVKTKKKDDPEGARPVVRKPSQSAKGVAVAHTSHLKKIVAHTGRAMQPTLSQLARMKAAEEEKARRVVAKGSTKPLMIRPKGRAIPPKTSVEEAEIPAVAIATPLPPSPEMRPADVPLHASPVPAPLVLVGNQDEHVAAPSADDTRSNVTTISEHPPMSIPTPTPTQAHSAHPFGVGMAAKTPISALVNSIQRGFLLSPNSPLSPAQPDTEWVCPAWPGLAISVGEEPSFEGVAESTMKQPLAVVSDPERRALVDMN